MMQTVTATTGRASVRAIARGTGAVRGANARSVKTTAAALGGDNEDNVGPSQLFHDGVKALEEKGTTAAAHVSTANNDALGKTGKCPFLGAKENEILKNSADRESNARGYVRKFPMAIKEAKGIMLTDVNGRKYYDILGCAGTLALGHNHDVTIKAIKDFLETGAPLQVLDLATPHKDEFIETLQSVLPDELSRVHFCSPAGTDCLDAAVKLCKIATGRRSVLSFHGGYHGMGQSMLSLMGNLGAKTPVTGLMPDVYFLPYPYEHRNPFGVKGEEGEKAVLHYIDTVLSDDESGVPKPACVVVEAIQGEGGVNEMSDWALRELRRITKKHDVPLVMDEVQAGFCRSGDFFAFNKSGIVPDVLCMSKAVGGSMPMATIAFTQELDVWGPAAHTGTFRGNQLAFATGTASINFMKETKMWEDVRRKGEVLRARMLKLQEETNVIGHVRGRGLMQGVELVDPNAPTDRMGLAPPSGALAAEVQLQCFKRGMLMEKGGRMGGVMRFLAPLIITDEELDICIGKFEESVKAAAAKHGM